MPEWHKTDHGLHAHFVCARFVRRSIVEDTWGHGFVKGLLIGDLPIGSTAVDEARIAARYIAKYMNKDIEQKHALGLHRYDVGEGFQPKKVKIPGPTLAQAVEGASEIMGCQPARFSTSNEWPGWSGPSAVAMSWAC